MYMQVIKPVDTNDLSVFASLARLGHGNSASLWWKITVRSSGEVYFLPHDKDITDEGLSIAIDLAKKWDDLEILSLTPVEVKPKGGVVELRYSLKTSESEVIFGIACSDSKNTSLNMEKKFPIKELHNFVIYEVSENNYKKGKLLSYIGIIGMNSNNCQIMAS